MGGLLVLKRSPESGFSLRRTSRLRPKIDDLFHIERITSFQSQPPLSSRWRRRINSISFHFVHSQLRERREPISASQIPQFGRAFEKGNRSSCTYISPPFLVLPPQAFGFPPKLVLVGVHQFLLDEVERILFPVFFMHHRPDMIERGLWSLRRGVPHHASKVPALSALTPGVPQSLDDFFDGRGRLRSGGGRDLSPEHLGPIRFGDVRVRSEVPRSPEQFPRRITHSQGVRAKAMMHV